MWWTRIRPHPGHLNKLNIFFRKAYAFKTGIKRKGGAGGIGFAEHLGFPAYFVALYIYYEFYNNYFRNYCDHFTLLVVCILYQKIHDTCENCVIE